MILKITRTIDDGTKKSIYKEDTHKDIAGYNNLLKDMLIKNEEEGNNDYYKF